MPEVQQYYKQLTEKFIRDWGFDGSKLDNIYTVPMCYNPAHHHKSPQDSVNAMADVYKTIYQTTRAIKPESVTQVLPVRNSAFAGLVAVHGSGSHRRSGWRGASSPSHQDVQSPAGPGIGGLWRSRGTLGDDSRRETTGASMETISRLPSEPAEWSGPNLSGPNPEPKFKPVALTQQKEEHWKKWIGIYNQKMLSKGTFLNLYTYGYDTPEAYAIEKDGKMYYAFFAPTTWKGEVELRGLEARNLPRERLHRRQGLGYREAAAGARSEAESRIQGSSAAGGFSLRL